MRLSQTDSKNSNSLIALDADKRNEPSKHVGYEERRVRARQYNAQIESQNGWTEFKVTRTQIVLRKNDSELVAYEKQLWRLFFNMGFPYFFPGLSQSSEEYEQDYLRTKRFYTIRRFCYGLYSCRI